jgi:hypothetical protein
MNAEKWSYSSARSLTDGSTPKRRIGGDITDRFVTSQSAGMNSHSFHGIPRLITKNSKKSQ